MKKFLLVIIIPFLFSSCATEVTTEMIRSMIFDQSRGLVAGIDLGDSWEYVKENHPEGWEVRESNDGGLELYQIRKDWEEGYNMMNLTFELDQNKEIKEMRFGLILSDDNRSELNEIQNLFRNDFNLLLGKTNNDQWTYIATDGSMYVVSLSLTELNEKTSDLSVLILEEN